MKTKRKRGRPRLDNAKRRCTTRQGRRTGVDPVDRGAPLLRAHKLVMTGREDVELTAAGVLYGHGHLDRHQFDSLALVTLLMQRIARAMGGIAPVHGLWLSIVGAATSGQWRHPIVGDANARRQLARILARLDGSKALVLDLAHEQRMPGICVRAADRELTAADHTALDRLRDALDGISAPAWWGDEPGG